MPTTVPQASGNTVDDPSTWPADLGYDYEFNAGGFSGTASLPAGWSWANSGATPTATYLEQWGAGTITAGKGSGHHVHSLKRGMNGWPSTWTVTAKLAINISMAFDSRAGLVLRDPTGKLTTFVTEADQSAGGIPSLSILRFTDDITFSATRQTDHFGSVSKQVVYLRIRKTGTTSYFFEASPDGRAWIGMPNVEDVSAFMTPNEIGFCVDTNNTSFDGAISCDWFRVR